MYTNIDGMTPKKTRLNRLSERTKNGNCMPS